MDSPAVLVVAIYRASTTLRAWGSVFKASRVFSTAALAGGSDNGIYVTPYRM
jgi:hypothetical protein